MCDQLQIVRQSDCGNLKIVWTNRRAFFLQLGAYPSINPSGVSVKIKIRIAGKKCFNREYTAWLSLAFKRAVEKFGSDD